MSQRRAHPLARREDELLQAALEASKHDQSSSSATASVAPPPPTKYGTLHGTLGTVTPSSVATPAARLVDRSSSDDRLAALLPSRTAARTTPHLVLPSDPSTYIGAVLAPTPQVLVADTPAAASPARAPPASAVSDPIVSVSVSISTRTTMATEDISAFPTGGKWVAENPIAVVGLRAEDDEMEVVGDSDGEAGGSSSLPFYGSSLVPLPALLPAASTSSSSAIQADSSRSLSKPSPTDPIATTGSSGVKAPRLKPREQTFTVEISPRAHATAAAAEVERDDTGRKRASQRGEKSDEEEHHPGDETDYEALPGSKARKGKEKKRARRTIVQSSGDEDEDETLAPAAEKAPSPPAPTDKESSPDPISVPSASAGAPPKRKRSASSASRRRTGEPAVSEDEAGQAAMLAALRAADERGEEEDEDYGGPKKKRTKSRKDSSKGKDRKAAPKRRPTVKKDGSAVPEPIDGPAPADACPSSSPAKISKPRRRPSKHKVAQVESERDDQLDEPQPVIADARISTPAPAGRSDDDEEVGGASKPAKRKMTIANDSEEDEAPAPATAPAPGAKPKKAAGKSKKKAPVAASPPVARRGRRTAASKNPYCPSSEAEPEPEAEDAGAASDATSAIKTGDELSDVDEDDEPVVRGEKKAKRTKGKHKGKGKGKVQQDEEKAEEPAVVPAPSSLASASEVSNSPDVSRRRNTSIEDRVAKLMKAADGPPEESLIVTNKANEKGKGKAIAHKVDADADDEDGSKAEPAAPSSSADTKENTGVGTPGPSRGNPMPRAGTTATPLQQRGRSDSATPGSLSKPPKPGSLAAIIAKRGLMTSRAPGLSARQKLPRLHANLKPPPPAKKILKDDKPKKKKKKGDESYSDEEKPWYERKDPEEWDDADHRRWQRRCSRIERGLPADSGSE
ncbi:hypothetical protein JCM3770_001578 [Rhodotorula araucariae]